MCLSDSDCPKASHEELLEVLGIVNASTVKRESGCNELKFFCAGDGIVEGPCEIGYYPTGFDRVSGEKEGRWSCLPCPASSSSGIQFPVPSSPQGISCPISCSCPCGCSFTPVDLSKPGVIIHGQSVLGASSVLGQGYLKQVWAAFKRGNNNTDVS